MIFRTTTDESTGAIKSIGLFGKSISELKTSFSSIKENGIINTLFNTSTIDKNAVNEYNNSITEAISNGSSFADKQEIMKSAMNNTNKATAQLIRSTKGAVVGTEALAAAQQASTLIARAQTVALKALSMAGNMLFMLGISEVIQLTVKGIQYLTGTNERLMKAQQDIIDKANENIQKYDDEISSLEKLQSKLEDSKNSKEALAKIQSELNNAIGFTPGLLNNESGAWNAANQKIADRIARLKELRKEELNRKIVAEKKQFENAEIDNKNGIDKSFDFYLNTKVNNTGTVNMRIKNKYGKYLDGLELDTKKTVTIKDIYETLKKNGYGEGEKSDAQIFATIIKDSYGGTLKGVNSKEIQKYFDKQTKRAQQYFIDTGIFEDYSGAFAQEELNAMIAKLVEGGYAADLEGIANVMDEIMNNDDLPKLIDEYYKSLFDKSKDSDVLYQQIEEQFNELTQKYPMLKSILDNIFNSISKDIENNVEQSLQTSFFDKLISIKEKMDTLTSSASSLSSALTTLYSGDYNSSDLLSSIMTINSAISQFGEDVSVDWENITSLDQLQEVVMGLSETYAKSILSDAGISTKNNPFAEMIQNSIAESIKLKAQLDGVNNALDSLQGNYKTLTDTIDTYNKYGYITIDQLQSLLEMDDKYLSCMVDENGQLNLNKTTYSNLAKIQLENAKATALTQYNSEVARIKQEALTRANQNLGLSIGLENGGLIGKLNDLSGEFTLLSKVMSVAKNIFGKIKNTFNEQKSKSQIDFDNRLLDKQAEEELAEAELAYNSRLKLIDSVSDNINNSMDNIMGNTESGSNSSTPSTTIFDWIETKVNNLTDALNHLKETSDDTYTSWADRSTALANAINTTRQAIDLQQQAYNRYMQEAEKSGLPDVYKNLIQNGAIDITAIDDDNIKEKISDYQSWYDKAKNCLDVQEDLKNSLNELNSKKFDNIQSIFDFDISKTEHLITMLNSQTDKLKMKGLFATESYYNQMLQYTHSKINSLTNERKQLADIMNSSTLSHDSEAWRNMYSTLSETDEQLSDLNKDLIEFNNNIRDLNWEIFEYLEESINRITDETEYLIELISKEDLFDKDSGNLNKYADAVLGLHAAAYDTYRQQAKDYYEEVSDLQKQLVNGAGKEVLEQYSDMLKAHQDAVLAAEDEKQAMLDLIEEGYNAQLEAIQKIIDKKKEQMSAEKNLYDYQKTIKEKTDNISSLEKQQAAYAKDDSEETMSKIQQLKVQLEDAKSDLRETEYEQYLSDTENMLDELSKDYEEWMNARLDNEDALLSEIMGTVADKGDEINATINDVAKEYRTMVSDSITSIFNSASPFTNILTNGFNSVSNSIAGTTSAIDRLITQVAGITNANAGKTNAGSGTSGSGNRNYNSSSGSSAVNKNTGSNGYSNGYNSSNGSNNNSADSSKVNAEQIFIHKTDTYPKNKLNTETSIVDRLKYYNFDSSFSARASYYSKLGGSGTYRGSDSQNTWLIQKMKSMGYKKGTNNAKAGFHWTQENGEEIIVRKSDGAVLTHLNKGDLVLDNESSHILWEFSQNPGAFMKKFGLSNLTPQINITAPVLPAMVGTNASAPLSMNVGDIEINLPNVKNYDEFKNQLIKDGNFEKAMFSAINHAATGKGNVFDKMKYTR